MFDFARREKNNPFAGVAAESGAALAQRRHGGILLNLVVSDTEICYNKTVCKIRPTERRKRMSLWFAVLHAMQPTTLAIPSFRVG